MTNVADPTHLQEPTSLPDLESCDGYALELRNRLTYHGTPTLNLSSLGIGRSDPVLVNNGAVDDTALLVAYEYFDILSITLPLFYKSERAFAELMDGLIEIRRADRSDGVSAYPTGNQDLARFQADCEQSARSIRLF